MGRADDDRPDGDRRAVLALALAAPLGALTDAIGHAVPATAQSAAPVPVAPSTPWRSLPETAVINRLVFGSCLDQLKPQPIWTAIRKAAPQLVLLMGDNVYGDAREPGLPELRAAYAAQARQPELAAARAELPFLAIWDDHDYGLNDGGADFAQKETAADIFAEFWQTPRPRGPGGGLYTSRIFGPDGQRVQIILLDTRSFRSGLAPKGTDFPHWGKYGPDDAAEKTMLGAAQWAWLADELRRPAEIRLIVSSIQVIAEGHGFERWGNLPRERTRLVELIKATNARGVVLLSGDRHIGAFYRQTEGLAYPLVEVTSSSLNRPYGPSRDTRLPPLVSDIYHPENFGQIDIDWTGRRVELALKDITGATVHREAIGFSDLGLTR